MRTLLDTNVLVRAAGGRGGSADRLLLRILEGPHVLITSEPLLAELQRALRYERLRRIHGLTDQQLDEYVQYLRDLAFIVPLSRAPPRPTVIADPDDHIVITTALLGKADVLCTWDRHFAAPAVQEQLAVEGVRVLRDDNLLSEL